MMFIVHRLSTHNCWNVFRLGYRNGQTVYIIIAIRSDEQHIKNIRQSSVVKCGFIKCKTDLFWSSKTYLHTIKL